jgi:hypothetical protein
MAQLFGEIMAAGEKYVTDSGEKTRWIKCGVLLQTDKGFRIKLESLPVGRVPGALWLNVFEPKEKEAPKQQSQGFRKSDPAPSAAPKQDELGDDSDIPF